ncbi:MAG: DnaB-like helicase N-terminal domain-containing protein, partial [Nitrospirales bacterium]
MELFDLEAEAYVLSGLLLNPGLIEEYDIHRDCFYRGAHQFIFLSMVDLLQSHESLDVLLVGARLKEMERLKEIGGYTALHELAEKAISAQSAPHYIEQIQELSRRRKWYTLGQTLVHASQNGGDSTELCQLAEEALRESLPSKSWQSLDACMRETLDEVEHAFKGSGGLGIEMGFRELDQRTG